MDVASPAAEEALRVAALKATGLAGTPPEARFDRIARVARRLIDAPIAMVNFVDVDRQWGKSCLGLPTSNMPRAMSFCQYAIRDDRPLVVDDTRLDPRFADNPLVTGEAGLRAYVGHPVRDPTGYRIGTLCVADRRPRAWSADELESLAELAEWVELEIASTNLRAMAHRVVRSEARLWAFIDGAAEGIITLDAEGSPTLANTAALDMLGYSLGELLGRSLHDAAHYQRPDGTPYPIEECPSTGTLTRGDVHRLLEETYWRRDGSPLAVDLSSTPLIDDGEITGAVLILRDATERRELERMKNDFVASVSHELRTPLTSIKGFVEGLLAEESGPLTDDQREDLDIVHRNTRRLQAQIDELLFLAAIEAGRLDFACCPVRLDSVLQRLVDDFAPVARDRGLPLEVSMSPLGVEGDDERLHQVFANLLSNALKFSPRGAVVRVVAGRRDGQAIVEVIDQGPGIPPDELERLGQRFFRASTAGTVDGSGLGLTIVQEIIDRHSGRLEIDSAVGEGSTFRVLLPAIEPPPG